MAGHGSNLSELYIDQCTAHKIKPDAIVMRVLDGKYSNEVTELDFSSNYLGSVGLRALFEALHGCPRLVSLSFEANYLKSEAIPPLVTLVNSLPACSSINLAKNTTLGFTAANHLMNLIKSHNQILYLDVSDTGIAKATQEQIQLLLEENRAAAGGGPGASMTLKAVRATTPPPFSLPYQGSGSPTFAPATKSSLGLAYPPYSSTSAGPPPESTRTRPRTPPHTSLLSSSSGSPRSSPTRIGFADSPSHGFEPAHDLHTYQQLLHNSGLSSAGYGDPTIPTTLIGAPYGQPTPMGQYYNNAPPFESQRHKSTSSIHSKPDYDDVYLSNITKTNDAVLKSQGKAPVIQHEERTLSDYAKMAEKCTQKRDNVRSRHAKGLELLEQYDANSTWPYTASYTVKQLIDDAHLNVPYDEVDTFHSQPANAYSATTINNLFDEVSDFNNAKRKITTLVEELRKMSKGCAPGTEALPDVVGQLYELLHLESTSVDHLREHLGQTDHKIPVLLSKVDQIDSARECAVREEDMEKAEGCHDASLRALEEVLDLILARLAVKNKGSTATSLDKVTELEEYAKKLLAPLVPHCEELMSRINSDNTALDTRRQEEQNKLEEATTAHKQYQRRAKEMFQQNTMNHNTLWAEIQTQYDKLKQLGEERYAEIEVWISETEKHERTKAQYDQVNLAIDKHKKTLADMLDQVRGISTIVQHYEGVVSKACTEVRRRADNSTVEIDNLALQEHKRHYEVFRKYYLTLGELIYKKEKRAEEIDRLIRTIDLQISISADTLDPHVQRHREFKKELERTKHTCRHKLDILRENGHKAAEDFKPTEAALATAGINIVSPLIELQEQNLERRAQLLQKVKTVVEQDKADVESESTGIEELSQSAKQARLAGRPSMIPPLSPSPPPSKWKRHDL
eukprot:TRINITY_DN61444_c0_g1_i1.p1 TRINITY_DN61444_c0_g1~~TRINITY_DN61444_c0_g1_i1.p1  ORF type:complete len:909 (+),score=98.87 TRINITY_DN61444_c0_g1_i1:36-2762(+)